MNIRDFILDTIAEKIFIKTINDQQPDIYQKLGKLAICIVEEKNQEIKQDLTEQYNKLKNLDNCEIKNIDINDVNHKTIKVVLEKINSLFKE